MGVPITRALLFGAYIWALIFLETPFKVYDTATVLGICNQNIGS